MNFSLYACRRNQHNANLQKEMERGTVNNPKYLTQMYSNTIKYITQTYAVSLYLQVLYKKVKLKYITAAGTNIIKVSNYIL
jgi:hypothetical protein